MDRTYAQPRGSRIFLLGAMGVLSVGLVGGGLSEGGLMAVGGCASAALAMAVAIRGWQLRIVLGSGVKIVNWFWTYDIPWVDVERFGYDGSSVWVRRSTGQQIAVAAFTSSPGVLRSVHRRHQKVAETLEAARKKRRGDGGGRDRLEG